MTMTHAARDGLVEQLDAHVREVVRREGVDPQADAGVVRRIAESVVRDHDERSLTGVVAPVPDVDAVVGELVARVSGFGPLQPYLDDPAVEELWINDPSRVFVARHGRHELTNLVLTRAQVQELVERMLKSSGRRIDLSQPFVDAMLPGRPPAARRAGGDQPRIQRGQRPQVHGPRAPPRQPGRARQPEPARGGVPRGVRARRAEHPGRRRHPDRQDDVPELLGRGDPRRRARGERGGSLRAAVHAPGLGRAPDPAARARGHRRGAAARPGQGVAADAAEPGDRGGGAVGGVPRPAARAQRRAAGDVHDPRQLRARGAGQVLHAAAAGGGEHQRPLRRAHGRGERGPGRAPRDRRARRTPRQRGRRGAGAGRERRDRDRADLRAARQRAAADRGLPPRLEQFERRGIDVHRLLTGSG